jgi:hypothetical protein
VLDTGSADEEVGAMEPKENPAATAAKRKSKRGGRRPGAGARRGNMNALKSGAYSRQFAELGRLLATDPKVRAVLLDVAARAGHKFKTANEEAAYLLTQWAERVEKNAEAKYAPKARKRLAKNSALSSAEGPVLSSAEGADRLNLELPGDDWDSIKQAAANYERKMRK